MSFSQYHSQHLLYSNFLNRKVLNLGVYLFFFFFGQLIAQADNK